MTVGDGFILVTDRTTGEMLAGPLRLYPHLFRQERMMAFAAVGAVNLGTRWYSLEQQWLTHVDNLPVYFRSSA